MVSIIIPVLNEEKTMKKNLDKLAEIKGKKEIIIVDGGSHDNTMEIGKKYGKIVKSQKGRARQMNAGAKEAKGDILWFIHLDSKVEKDSIEEIEKVIENGYIGGCFRLYFYDLNTKFMKYVENSSNRRAKYLKLIFGDQGIFMRKDIFNELGGYGDMELMEDWDMSRRIHKLGKMKVVDKKIGTSARRFEKGGQVRTLLMMHKIKILYILGTPTHKLAKIYKEVR